MSDAQTYYLAGLKLFGEEKHAEAIAQYDQALALKPNWTDAMHALATSQSKLGNQELAIETVNKIIELEPEDAFAYTSLSIFLMRMGKIPEAEAAGAKARMVSWKQELKTNPNAAPPKDAGGMDVIQ